MDFASQAAATKVEMMVTERGCTGSLPLNLNKSCRKFRGNADQQFRVGSPTLPEPMANNMLL
jgi:hypothetical protein